MISKLVANYIFQLLVLRQFKKFIKQGQKQDKVDQKITDKVCLTFSWYYLVFVIKLLKDLVRIVVKKWLSDGDSSETVYLNHSKENVPLVKFWHGIDMWLTFSIKTIDKNMKQKLKRQQIVTRSYLRKFQVTFASAIS